MFLIYALLIYALQIIFLQRYGRNDSTVIFKIMIRTTLSKIFILFFILTWGVASFAQPITTQQNEVAEISFLSSKDYSDPFTEIELDVIFTGKDGKQVRIPAFWDGDRVWKVRFSSPVTGGYSYRTACSDRKNQGLHNQKGNLAVLEYTGNSRLLGHGPLKISPDRRIVHQDGTSFLWLADSWWHGMTARFKWPDEFQILTRDRREKGFSVIQFALGYPCDIREFDSRGANEAGFPTSRDYSAINPDYFKLADRRIQHLIDNDLFPNILGTWGYYLPWFGIDHMKRYWRYLVARYGAYPVTWTLAGETTLVYYLTDESQREEIKQFQREGWAEIAAYIKETDPFNRLITAHPGPSSGNFQPITDMSNLDIIMVQPGHRGWETLPNSLDHLNKARTLFPERPVMQGEVCFEGMMGGGSDAKLQRVLFWTNMMSGAAGHCYGVDGIWQFNTEEELFGASPGGYTWGNTPWEQAHKWKGSFFVGLGRKILQRYNWQDFEFNDEWIDPSADENDVQDAYAAGTGDSIRLFYFPKGVMPWGQPYTVKGLNSQSSYQAAFIDPLTGKNYPIKELITGTRHWTIPHAPILQDWLLEVRRTDPQSITTVPRPVNPDASPEARQLLKYLYSIQGRHTLSGQHNYPGTISRYTDEAFALTGEFPVVWGQDFGFTATGQDGIDNRDDIIKEAIERHEQGFIITLMWHAVRPVDDEPSGWKESVQNDLTDEEWKELVTPGTDLYNRWIGQLDVVAGYLKILRDENIPVLWRPYHEMNGKWFWWGDKKGEEGFQALWWNMYDHFVNHHKLNNLIWVWNANALVNPNIGDYYHYFPGLDVVDVLATDFYGGNYDPVNQAKLLELAGGKPLAIGECGELPSIEILDRQPYWTWFMCWAGFLERNNTRKKILELYSDPRIFNRKDVRWEQEW